jgi:DnaJ-class molecular chaperone
MPDAAAARSLVLGEPCRCVWCGECLGSGVVRSENPIADYDLDPCEGCGGSGIVEACDRCQLLTEMEYDN